MAGGDPLKSAAWLVEAGVPQPDADRIDKDLETAEQLVDPRRRNNFSLFEGLVSEGSDPHDFHR